MGDVTDISEARMSHREAAEAALVDFYHDFLEGDLQHVEGVVLIAITEGGGIEFRYSYNLTTAEIVHGAFTTAQIVGLAEHFTDDDE